MGKRVCAALLSLVLMTGLLSGAAGAAESWTLDSATWQDPNHVILMWTAREGETYEIYRSQTRDGDYALIGTASSGSFRDDEAAWPESCYYRVCPLAPDGTKGAMSEPMQAGTNSQSLSKVTVLMYHNFITQEDVANGVEFEEYSLDPADFEADLQYFRDNGYTTITSEDLLAYINGEKPLPDKALIISIDDGTQGVYTNAWPLLKKYRMKADFNLIGEQVDAAWETVDSGGTRLGESAPYCVWEELIEMQDSGEINLCSHTYALHRYNREGRIGASLLEGETLEDYAAVIRADYELMVSCLGGWTGENPTTMAYPYSRRSEESDAALLEDTGYEILMAGEGARGTASNYFVDGASAESQLRLMSRPCRMEGHPAREYLEAADQTDQANGVNAAEDTAALTAEECAEIALWYSPYADVAGDAWYAGAVYYTYVNTMLTGTSLTTFSPDAQVSRAMAAGLLYHVAGEPAVSGAALPEDVAEGSWYAQAARWAVENNLFPALEGELFRPEEPVTREELVTALYRCAQLLGQDTGAAAEPAFPDWNQVSGWAEEAVRWAADTGILKGDGQGRLLPQESLTRAQLAAILQTWGGNQAGAQ